MDGYLKEKRRFELYLKKSNYHILDIECCFTCRWSGSMPEEDLTCNKFRNSEWSVNNVSELGKCDNYAGRE